jgi:hypothetical protein
VIERLILTVKPGAVLEAVAGTGRSRGSTGRCNAERLAGQSCFVKKYGAVKTIARHADECRTFVKPLRVDKASN